MRRTLQVSTVVIVIGCLSLTACTASPQNKVRQVEEANKALQESSGYNECMRKVKEDEGMTKQCVADKLKADGFTDGIDCIAEYNAAPCEIDGRYKSQVTAYEFCQDESKTRTQLTEGDCTGLLMQAQ